MRMTQFAGLTTKADTYLDRYGAKVVAEECPHCNQPIRYKLDCSVYDHTYGMFEEEIGLHRYTLKSGKTVKEIVQAAPWSSGPVIFLCLEDEQGKRLFEWPQKEIDNC